MNDDTADVKEFSDFYVENVPRLVTFLVCQGVSVADAADCVQEALIAALPPVWPTLNYPYAWCRRVAYRRACKLSRRRESPVAEPELAAGSPLIAPGTAMESVEHDHDFLRWLGRLNGDMQRKVLAWTYDGATPEEIATELQMHPATVRSTLRHARAALRSISAKEDEQK